MTLECPVKKGATTQPYCNPFTPNPNPMPLQNSLDEGWGLDNLEASRITYYFLVFLLKDLL